MDKLIDLINQGGTGEYDARQPQERGEAVANAGGLLPCPFCGDDDCQVSVMQEGESGDDYSFSAEAQCVCGATGPEAYASCQSDAALSAINTWNRRAHPPADDARVAELEERERLRLAGISTAAIGYWKERDSIHPDYDTVALRDVAGLYAKYAAQADRIAALHEHIAALEAQLAASMEREGRMREALKKIAKWEPYDALSYGACEIAKAALSAEKGN